MERQESQENQTIPSLSLKDIILRAKQISNSGDHHYQQGYLVGHFNAEYHSMLTHNPLRLDAIMFVLCTKGSVKFTCNMQEYEVHAGSLLLLPPRSIIEAHIDVNTQCEGYAMVFDSDYLGKCNFNIGKFTALMLQIVEQFQITLTETEQQRLIQSITMLDQTIAEQVDSPFREDLIRSMIETLMYHICELFSLRIKPEESKKMSRQESYFRKFMLELNQHYTERQGVTFYAEKLCISPRYLTTIVRRISGLTVTDWMNRYLIMEAKYLLKYSEMSIQEIAFRLSFPDQSFFGKYFKQHMGISPSQYRNQ